MHMPLNKLTQYLDDHKVKYVVVSHSKAFTAQEVAASAHIPGKEMAKTVIVEADGDMKMVVVPSTHNIDFGQLKEAMGADNVSLASEEAFRDRFPDCELGAMPPFGNLYDMETIVAESLAEDNEITFNAGTHKEAVKLAFEDFMDLVKPKVLKTAVKHA